MYFLIPLVNLIGLVLVNTRYPRLLYLVGLVIIGASLTYVYKITQRQKVHRLAIMLSLFLFLIAHYLLLLFLEGKFLIYALIILSNFALFVFLYTLYDKCKWNRLKLSYALENIVGYFNLAIFFFLSIDILFFDLNTNQMFLWFVLIFSLSVMALIYSSLNVFDALKGKAVWYIGVILLIMIEMFWIIALLPIAVYSKAGLLTIVFYIVLGLSKHYLIFGLPGFNRKVVGRYLAISISGCLAILLTTRW